MLIILILIHENAISLSRYDIVTYFVVSDTPDVNEFHKSVNKSGNNENQQSN